MLEIYLPRTLLIVFSDGKEDYILVHPETGAITVWLNRGPKPDLDWKWYWEYIGQRAEGLGGPGKNVRIADMDGDGVSLLSHKSYVILKVVPAV